MFRAITEYSAFSEPENIVCQSGDCAALTVREQNLMHNFIVGRPQSGCKGFLSNLSFIAGEVAFSSARVLPFLCRRSGEYCFTAI